MYRNFWKFLLNFCGQILAIEKYLKALDLFCSLFGLAYKGQNIVFRFIIEYSSLWDFGP
jgi:hypothetical protein